MSTSDNPPSDPSSTPSPKLDKDFYNWSTFFSILTGSASPREADAYLRVRDDLHEASDCAKCEQQTAWLLKYSPIVRFLRQNIQMLGQDINETNVHCRRCTTAQSGGFDPEYGILICANQLRNRGHQEDTMAHEMVHAWDYLRFKYEDPRDLRHAACTEIRASTLSGECRFGREFFTRGQRNITQQLQECVRRRATLSVMQRPACKDKEHAAKVVNDVWKSCFYDTRPFDEIYR
ncbi:peptidase M76 family-domain-containing protein [Elsinoe ampelina]|uniref:Mitochondrial inner membrane protease ATP23 n=1 Tax=Elsinoe ampelina TaxID=302913 RepID=A0A6A6GM24_9PEZI|nr:peptidase M76 family-domain-containing protein [Elsinoe ampelina]